MAKKSINVTLHINGTRTERLSDKQSACFADRLSLEMGNYYTAHVHEYQSIKKEAGCDVFTVSDKRCL